MQIIVWAPQRVIDQGISSYRGYSVLGFAVHLMHPPSHDDRIRGESPSVYSCFLKT